MNPKSYPFLKELTEIIAKKDVLFFNGIKIT